MNYKTPTFSSWEFSGHIVPKLWSLYICKNIHKIEFKGFHVCSDFFSPKKCVFECVTERYLTVKSILDVDLSFQKYLTQFIFFI